MIQPFFDLRPGQRIRVSFEGRAVPRDDRPGRAAIQVGDESIWAIPTSATVEVLSTAADPSLKSESSEQQVTFTDNHRQVWRQVGWVGQSGQLYGMVQGDVLKAGEPGGFSPVWQLVDVEPVSVAVVHLERKGSDG